MNNDIRKLKEFLENTLDEMENEKDSVYVGELPYELVKLSKVVKREKERLNEDVELRELQLILEVKRKLKEEFDERTDLIEKKHNDLWEQIYDCMMIDKDGHYYQENGSLFRILEKSEWKKNPQFTKPH